MNRQLCVTVIEMLEHWKSKAGEKAGVPECSDRKIKHEIVALNLIGDDIGICRARGGMEATKRATFCISTYHSGHQIAWVFLKFITYWEASRPKTHRPIDCFCLTG